MKDEEMTEFERALRQRVIENDRAPLSEAFDAFASELNGRALPPEMPEELEAAFVRWVRRVGGRGGADQQLLAEAKAIGRNWRGRA